jgi:hypothetical protein
MLPESRPLGTNRCRSPSIADMPPKLSPPMRGGAASLCPRLLPTVGCGSSPSDIRLRPPLRSAAGPLGELLPPPPHEASPAAVAVGVSVDSGVKGDGEKAKEPSESRRDLADDRGATRPPLPPPLLEVEPVPVEGVRARGESELLRWSVPPVPTVIVESTGECRTRCPKDGSCSPQVRGLSLRGPHGRHDLRQTPHTRTPSGQAGRQCQRKPWKHNKHSRDSQNEVSGAHLGEGPRWRELASALIRVVLPT